MAGAYRFHVTPGAPTSIAVQTTLYPRKQLPNVGIAPLTSMFLFSAINRARINDFRPAVHDFDGLAILNGWGEHLWRPLNNPRRLQTSNFLDQDPRGFGLIQRSRAFAQYQDLEAQYERRPSAWVEPAESWGPGSVELFEDSFGGGDLRQHRCLLEASAAARIREGAHIQLPTSWPNDVPRSWPGAVVHATRSGLINGPQRKSGALQFAVELKGLSAGGSADLPVARIDASAGACATHRANEPRYRRPTCLVQLLIPKGAGSSELRLGAPESRRQAHL